MKLDPLDSDNKLYYARDLIRAREFDEGIRQCNLFLLEKPNSPGAYGFLYRCHAGKKQFEEAGEDLVKYAELLGDDKLAEFYRNSDFKSATEKMLSYAVDSMLPSIQGLMVYAGLYAILEDRNNTFKYLDIAYKNRDPRISALRGYQFDFIKNDPRYNDLYEKVGFKAYDAYKAKHGVVLK